MKWLAGRVGGNNAQETNIHGDEESSSNSSSRPSTTQESFPTPASLAEVMLSTRQMLTGEVSECLLVRSNYLILTNSVKFWPFFYKGFDN